MTVVTHEEVSGMKVPIEVNSDGWFTASVGDGLKPIREKTLDEARMKVRAAVKRLQAQKEIEVTVLGAKFDGFDVKRGDRDAAFDAILRGVAERTDRLMFTIGGKKVQSDGYSRSCIVTRRLTAAEVTQYKALVKTALAAEKDVQVFVEAVAIDPEKATKVSDGE